MGIVLDTPLVHKSFTSVLQKITPNAHIYDNPNQQGTKIPAWFIVHREPVTIERDLDKRAWLTYGIDLYYMLDYNLPRTFDSYSSVADALNTELKYLTIYGTTFKVHVQNRSWSLQLDCLRYSTTLKFRVSETEEPETKMQVIEDLAVFLKNQPPEPPFYDITVEPSENGHVETDRDKAQKGRVITVTPYPDKDYLLQTIRVMCGARNIPVTDNSFIMPDGPVSIYSEFVEAPVAVLWRFFDDREPEPIMGYRYIHNLSKAKPIDHGEAHVLDVSASVLSKGKPIDHGEVEVITPEIMPMMAARMIDHGSVSVLDVELDRMWDNVSISYLNANKSQSTLTPSYSYNWLLYDYNGSAQTADSNATYTLKPAIAGLYLLVDAGRLYLNGTPTRELTLSKVSYTVEEPPAHQEWKAYFNSNLTSKTLSYTSDFTNLYNSAGNLIRFGWTPTVTVVQVFKANGDVATVTDGVNEREAISGTQIAASSYSTVGPVLKYYFGYTGLTGTAKYLTSTIDPEPQVAYFNKSKTAVTLMWNSLTALFDESGSKIPYDDSKRYHFFMFIKDYSGNVGYLDSSHFSGIVLSKYNGNLYIQDTYSSPQYQVYKVIYTVEEI